MLRRWREAYGLGLERAGQLLRTAAEEEGLRAPAANFQTLSQHERGEVYPGPHYRAAYCRLYQANEAELGFRRPLPGETARDAPPDRADDDDVRRREFLGSALVGSAAVVTAVVVPSFAGVKPMRLERRDLNRYRRALTRLYELDDQYGGDAGVYALAVRSVRQIRRALNHAGYEPDVGRDLLTTIGEASEHAGWLAYDAGQHAAARSWWLEALHASRLVDSAAVAVVAMASMSLQASSLDGNRRDAIDLAQSAQRVTQARMTPRLRSLLLAREALGHAMAANKAASHALGQAVTWLDCGRRDEDPPWLDFWGPADLASHERHATFRPGDFRAAERAARQALTLVDPATHPRNHALYLAYLAEVLVARRALDEAVPVTTRAVTHAVDLDSMRITTRLRKVLGSLYRDASDPAVQGLLAWAAKTLPSASSIPWPA